MPLSLAEITHIVRTDPDVEEVTVSVARVRVNCTTCCLSVAWLIREDFLVKCASQPQRPAAFKNREDVLRQEPFGIEVFAKSYRGIRWFCICHADRREGEGRRPSGSTPWHSITFESLQSPGPEPVDAQGIEAIPRPTTGEVVERKEQLAQARATLAGFGLEGVLVYLRTFYGLAYGQIAAELNGQFAEKAKEIVREPYTEARISNTFHRASQRPAEFGVDGLQLHLVQHNGITYEQIAAEMNRQFAEKAKEIEKEPYTEATIRDTIHRARQNPAEFNVPGMMIAALMRETQDVSYGQIAAEMNRQFAEKAKEIEREPYTEARVKDGFPRLLIRGARQNPPELSVPGIMMAALQTQGLTHEQIAAEMNRQFAEKAKEIEKEPYTDTRIRDAIHRTREKLRERHPQLWDFLLSSAALEKQQQRRQRGHDP